MSVNGDTLALLQVFALFINGILVLIVWPLRQAIDALKTSDDKLSNRIQHLEVKVAENYVQRSELSTTLNNIDSKIDRIEAILSSQIASLQSRKKDRDDA